MEIDKIITGDSAIVLQSFPPDCIDLTVTSPPYDNMKDYEGNADFDFLAIANQLYRVSKIGGVAVWVVNDAVVDGSETGTSFRQALYFMQLGFKLHDTMIYKKTGMSKASVNRYHQIFEYMFIFSKDGAPKTFNPIKDRKNKYVGLLGGNAVGGRSLRGEFGMRFNIWEYANGKNHTAKWNDEALEHPAPFPEALAQDHILSWSNEGDTVLDCFTGSGTTLKMAKILKRHYIGIEKVSKYAGIAERRLSATDPLFGQGRGLTQRAADGYAVSQQAQLFTAGEQPAKVSGKSRRR